MVFKKLFQGKKETETPDYIEVDVGKEEKDKSKIVVRPFILKTFDDVSKILEVLREGYTIALIDIKPLKQKDVSELKRAVLKLKKTIDALEGHMAGFSDNIIVATPSFIDIYKGEKGEQQQQSSFQL